MLEDASSFEGADKDAFSNSTWESNRPTVLFPNFSTYQNADETKKMQWQAMLTCLMV